jgi:glycosyltransferase involved in cell wall biosynthesis
MLTTPRTLPPPASKTGVSTLTTSGRVRVLPLGKYYPPEHGGMENHLRVLCDELRDSLDLSVVVASKTRQGSKETVDGVPVTRLSTLLDFFGAPVCPAMVQALNASGADILHIHWPNPLAVLAYFASGFSGPLVFTYHSDIVRQKLLGSAFSSILHKALDRSSAIIATSNDYMESSVVLKAHRDKCKVIPFGIPLEHFHTPDPHIVDWIRNQYGPSIVVAVGRLVGYKGFEYLVRAMKKVDGHLLLIGNGPLRGELESQARALGLFERVTILSGVADVVPYYHAADVFVLPSVNRSEAFGMVQIEAMACGKPVVNTKLDSGVPFVSRHEETGLTVPPCDSDALAKAIQTLLRNSELRARMGAAAKLRVHREFNVEVMARKTLDVYESLMNGPAVVR